MARKRKIIELPVPVEWVPPPVTKEEALNQQRLPNDTWEGDGYDHQGGGELADDHDIDRMVFPHDEGPDERKVRERGAERESQAEKFREMRFARSREFRIGAGNVTGQKPGPLSLFEDDC